jgi:hypothetical protein
MEKIFFDHPWVVILILLWTLPWKGAALWIAARRGSVGWFLLLLVLNSLAVLDILYIFIFSKWGIEKSAPQKTGENSPQQGQEIQETNQKFSYNPKNGRGLV